MLKPQDTIGSSTTPKNHVREDKEEGNVHFETRTNYTEKGKCDSKHSATLPVSSPSTVSENRKIGHVALTCRLCSRN